MRKLMFPFFFILLLPLFFVGCRKESPLPILETKKASNIFGTSAFTGGTIITNKSAIIQESGVCWSTINEPDINDSRTLQGSKHYSYASVMDDLIPATEYYYRAYVISSEGVAYGNTLKLKTMPDSSSFLQTKKLAALTLRNIKATAFLQYPEQDQIQRKGFCYAQQSMPTIMDKVADFTSSSNLEFYSYLSFRSGDINYIRSFIELKNGHVYYGEPLSFKAGDIGITAVDKLTFRSARLIIENDPHPKTLYVSIRDQHSTLARAFDGGATTFHAYLSNLKPDTTYQLTAWLGYSGDLQGFKDYAGTISFTTPPMPFIGNGSFEDPYSVDGALHYTSFPDHVWLEGYIVGEYANSGSNFNPHFNILENILIACDKEEVFHRNTVYINLPQGPVRDALNLNENPENKGAKIKLYGKVYEASNSFVTITDIQDFEFCDVVSSLATRLH